MRKPILCLDFDGVIHGYQSGWKGAAVIPDPPVPGALEFIVTSLDHFDVHILSSRSHQWGGRRAMKRYLRREIEKLGTAYETTPEWLKLQVATYAFADPWPEDVSEYAGRIVRQIKWPLFKPPAVITIDDRALNFDGTWPALDTLKSFQPWNKRKALAAFERSSP